MASSSQNKAGRSGPRATRAAPVNVAKSNSTDGFSSRGLLQQVAQHKPSFGVGIADSTVSPASGDHVGRPHRNVQTPNFHTTDAHRSGPAGRPPSTSPCQIQSGQRRRPCPSSCATCRRTVSDRNRRCRNRHLFRTATRAAIIVRLAAAPVKYHDPRGSERRPRPTAAMAGSLLPTPPRRNLRRRRRIVCRDAEVRPVRPAPVDLAGVLIRSRTIQVADAAIRLVSCPGGTKSVAGLRPSERKRL